MRIQAEPVPLDRVRGAKDTGRRSGGTRESTVGGIIYLIGLIVVIMAILSFLGLR